MAIQISLEKEKEGLNLCGNTGEKMMESQSPYSWKSHFHLWLKDTFES